MKFFITQNLEGKKIYINRDCVMALEETSRNHISGPVTQVVGLSSWILVSEDIESVKSKIEALS